MGESLFHPLESSERRAVSHDSREKLEEARRAVEETYGESRSAAAAENETAQAGGEESGAGGEVDSRSPQDPAPVKRERPGSRTAADALARARALARGAPAAARKDSSLWRRILRAFLGRLIRFETAWQREFNLAVVAAVEESTRRVDEIGDSVERIRRDLGETRAGVRRALEGLDRQERQAERLLTELERTHRSAEQSARALDRRLQKQERAVKKTADETHTRTRKIEESLASRDEAFDTELGRFRNQVKQSLRSAENLRRGLLSAAQRVTVLENSRKEMEVLSTRLERFGRDLASTRRDWETLSQEQGRLADELSITRRDWGAARQRQEAREREQETREREREAREREQETREREREARERELSGGLESLARRLGLEESHVDALEFARRFRGSEEEIRWRLRRYIDELRFNGVAGLGPVLEIGSGRGEFLHLCRESGMAALGIDSDPEVVAHCAAAGLDVQIGEATSYLAARPDGSLGAVFSAQTIEHLPPGALQTLIREAYRVLKPGGLLILETLNPACLSILATTFYRDPSHRQPLHPDTATFLLESTGFENVRVVPHSPVPADQRLHLIPVAEGDSPEVAGLKERLNQDLVRLNDLLFSDQEYHVIGSRP
jgi:SAM-dependent methyltransferase